MYVLLMKLIRELAVVMLSSVFNDYIYSLMLLQSWRTV